jgi:cobalamin biosynthesis protein CobW
VKIPATVITGFLGAGKTTLIRHLIGEAGGRRLAMVINEFGDLGIDRELLLGCGIAGCGEDSIVELANGCICCTVADAFLPTMEMLLGRPDPPDHIVIETSGLALPKPLLKAFHWPEVRSRLTVDGVVAVIDAPAVAAGRFAAAPPAAGAAEGSASAADHDAPLEELLEDQLAAADLVILNKTDLVDATALAAARSRVLRSTRPATKLLAAVHGRLDVRVVLGLAAGAEEDLAARPSHHDGDNGEHDHDDFTSFVAELGPFADTALLAERIRAAAETHDVLRIKGFVDVPGKPMRYVIQAVGDRVERYFDRPWRADEDRRTRLVVIGEHGLDIEAVRRTLAG